jgi:hypothetical protein
MPGDTFFVAIRASWAPDTASDPAVWSPATPAIGQCAITALIIQDELGGDLLRCPAPGSSHYWNLLPDTREIDLTREQFADGLDVVDVQVRDRGYVLSFPATDRRYNVLRQRVRSQLLGAVA